MVKPAQMPYRSATNLLFDVGDYPRGVEMAADLIDLPALRRRQAAGEADGRVIGRRLRRLHRADRARLRRVGDARHAGDPGL